MSAAMMKHLIIHGRTRKISIALVIIGIYLTIYNAGYIPGEYPRQITEALIDITANREGESVKPMSLIITGLFGVYLRDAISKAAMGIK